MFVNLRLGIRDIGKSKLHFLASVYMLLFFHIILFMFSMTIDVGSYQDNIYTISPTVVNTSYTYVFRPNELEGLRTIYASNAYSYRKSYSLSDITQRPVYLIFGDASLFDSNMINEDGVHAYAYDNESQPDINYLGEAYPLIHLPRSNDNFDPESIFVSYQGSSMIDVVSSMSAERPDVFYDLIMQTVILSSDEERIDSFYNYIDNDVDGVYTKGRIQAHASASDFDFVCFHLLPFLLILLLFGILSFVLSFHGRMDIQKKDLTVHLLSGAGMDALLLRFVVYYGSTVMLSLFAVWALGLLFYPFVAKIIVLSHFIILVLFIVYILLALNRSNLSRNLRGVSV